MAKRIVSGILGIIAVLASVLPLGGAWEMLKDFSNPDVAFWFNVLGELLACSVALAGLWIGIRFLLFALSGRTQEHNGSVRPVLLGIGFFFPAFVFSLPLTLLWARFEWRGDGDAAMKASCYIGVASAIVCVVVLLRKRKARQIGDSNAVVGN